MTDERRRTLDLLIAEKTADIYFLLKEELEVKPDSRGEKILFNAVEEFKKRIEELKSEVGYIQDITSYNHESE